MKGSPRFVKAANIGAWAYLRLTLGHNNGLWRDDSEFESDLRRLRDGISAHGMISDFKNGKKQQIDPQNLLPTIEHWLHQFAAHSQHPVKLAFIILPERAKDRVYNHVKYVADRVEGLHTICAVDTKFCRAAPDFLANIGLKFNLKLGGTNHSIDPTKLGLVSEGKTMIVGIDVTHASPGSFEPSIAGVVASIDKDLAQWPAELRAQETSREEMVEDLEGLLVSRLRVWQKHNNNALPENIIVYRDGVSEGQYQTVLDKESLAIKAACAKVYPASQTKEGRPRLTIVIVSKRHNTRFYPADSSPRDRNGNPLPGTVVDRGITEARNWDFFLQSHAAVQGTARPAHYIVIYDEIFRFRQAQKPSPAQSSFKPPVLSLPLNRSAPKTPSSTQPQPADDLEQLTHNMCYLYGRATKSVSIPPPVYYAHLMCKRARCYLERYKADGVSEQGLREKERWMVHERLGESMFYI